MSRSFVGPSYREIHLTLDVKIVSKRRSLNFLPFLRLYIAFRRKEKSRDIWIINILTVIVIVITIKIIMMISISTLNSTGLEIYFWNTGHSLSLTAIYSYL